MRNRLFVNPYSGTDRYVVEKLDCVGVMQSHAATGNPSTDGARLIGAMYSDGPASA